MTCLFHFWAKPRCYAQMLEKMYFQLNKNLATWFTEVKEKYHIIFHLYYYYARKYVLILPWFYCFVFKQLYWDINHRPLNSLIWSIQSIIFNIHRYHFHHYLIYILSPKRYSIYVSNHFPFPSTSSTKKPLIYFLHV